MGTYGYSASNTVNLKMLKCHMDDIHDRSRWGVMGTNNMKNFLVEDCVLSRVDVHKGVSGFYIIRNSTIGHGGINAIGSGKLIVEHTTLHSSRLISFRQDYGSTWDGDVLIRNCHWTKPGKNAAMFVLRNDGTHDFGYPCSMPSLIRIDELKIKDPTPAKNNQGIYFFGNSLAYSLGEKPFPYRLTKRIEIRNLETSSGILPQVSRIPAINKAISVVPVSAIQSKGGSGKKK